MSSDEEEGEERKGEAGEGVEDTLGDYEGPRNKVGERHGYAWAKLPNGDIYVGHYIHGKRHGRGVYVFTRNGARYDGDYRRGIKYGHGVFWYPDGGRYEGEWKMDMKHGFGVYYYPNGDVYEGAWRRNLRHGLGTYVFKEQDAKFMGTWIKGQMEGPGSMIHNTIRFHGTWKQNLPFGKGAYTFSGKYIQHGYYVHVRDPEYDNARVGENEGEGDTRASEPPLQAVGGEMGEGDEGAVRVPLGMVPVWRACKITLYSPDLLPPQPSPLYECDSLESLPDVLGTPPKAEEEMEPEEVMDEEWMGALEADAEETEEEVEEEEEEGEEGENYIPWDEVQKKGKDRLPQISRSELEVT